MRIISVLLACLALVACSSSNEQNDKGNPNPKSIETPSKVKEQFSDTVRDVLANADSFELVTLDPMPVSATEESTAKQRLLGSYKVLGASMVGKAEQVELLNSLYRGIQANGGEVAACFNPRHGIVATKGKNKVELVICFECLSLNVSLNGERQEGALTESFPAKTFNKVARAHKLKIAGKK